MSGTYWLALPVFVINVVLLHSECLFIIEAVVCNPLWKKILKRGFLRKGHVAVCAGQKGGKIVLVMAMETAMTLESGQRPPCWYHCHSWREIQDTKIRYQHYRGKFHCLEKAVEVAPWSRVQQFYQIAIAIAIALEPFADISVVA